MVSFFICWVPFHAQRLLASYLAKSGDQNQFVMDILHKLTYVSGVTYYLSSTINPLLYQLMSAKFRLAFKETFNCSLFRFFSCCLSADSSVRHSPTNSLKDHHHHQPHYHHHSYHSYHQNSSGASCCGGGGEKFRRIDSKASQLGGCECSAICEPASSDITVVLPDSGGAGVECSLEVSPIGQQQQQQGMVARLRGRFKNSSLVSLFRASQDNLALANGGGCPCCARHRAAIGQLEAAGGQQQQRQSGRSESLAVSTPLLAGHNNEERHSLRNANGGHFAAHSMLKFIRSATPVVCGGAVAAANGQAASLTRLSSREDDEGEENEDKGERKEANPTEEGPGKAAPSRMDSLIRATRDTEADTEEPADSSEQNSTSLIMSAGSSSAAPSQGSSPEQQAPQQQQQLGHSSAANHARGAVGPRATRRVKKLSSCSNSTGSGTGSHYNQQQLVPAKDSAEPQPRYRRRRSLQQHHNHSHHHHHHQQQPISGAGAAGPAQLQGSARRQNRKSSLCSADNNNHKQLSCSLSSSCDRNLDKKLSLSTTTSAIGSFTTTNSQLTAADSASDSWPASRLAKAGPASLSPPDCRTGAEPDSDSDSDSGERAEIEQELATVIQDQAGLNYELADSGLLDARELRRPLLERQATIGSASACQTAGAQQEC